VQAAAPRPDQPTGGAEDPWRTWIRQVGARLRRIREYIGMSQEQLGRLAGVSQGAVSRLEVGRGLQTPLVVVVKIHLALTQRLRELEPSLVSEEFRRVMDSEQLISPPIQSTGYETGPISGDPVLDDIVRTYRDLPPSRRETFRSVVVAAAEALTKTP
jgi:transcriptional regulator with XRE-family HTH domain